ncbi:MAG: UDP-N-acetylmuramoylalanyl-D-glutamyl-2,6-diaminopimelate--D-alanyl-D-alanine ligase [Rhizobiaceae bacterium]
MSNLLWSLEAMVVAMDAKPVGKMPKGISGLSIDTRSLENGDAYFAIKGDVHDGHKFVANAYQAGAGLSVVSQSWLNRLEGEVGPLLVVEDVLIAMEKLGVAARTRTNAKVIAVTGSVGKTSTKEALRIALLPSGKVHAAVASFNNHWGVPLTLGRMAQDTEFAIIEIGMNHPGEITPLVKMARPHVAMIMNVAAVHLGAFKDIDEIALAKAEIFDGLEENGTIVLNADDQRLGILENRALELGIKNIVRFGEADHSQAQLEKLVLHGHCSCLTAKIMGDGVAVKIGAPGRHIAQNILGVLAVVRLVDGDLAKAGLALANMQAVKGRGQQHRLSYPGERIILIDESYNANPTSMAAALALLAAARTKSRGRHIAILGDMLELGETSDKLHADLADEIVENNIERVFLAGPRMLALKKELTGRVECTHVNIVEELIPLVLKDLRGGDALMVKASLGMKFAQLIDALLLNYPQKS